jgi:hypothetical protein
MKPMRLGLKAPHITAWAEASPTSAGPGQPSPRFSRGLKGRNNSSLAPHVPPLQGGGGSWTNANLGLHPRLLYGGPSALNALPEPS